MGGESSPKCFNHADICGVKKKKKRKKYSKKQNRLLTALKINVLHQGNRRLTLPKEAKFSL